MISGLNMQGVNVETRLYNPTLQAVRHYAVKLILLVGQRIRKLMAYI